MNTAPLDWLSILLYPRSRWIHILESQVLGFISTFAHVFKAALRVLEWVSDMSDTSCSIFLTNHNMQTPHHSLMRNLIWQTWRSQALTHMLKANISADSLKVSRSRNAILFFAASAVFHYAPASRGVRPDQSIKSSSDVTAALPADRNATEYEEQSAVLNTWTAKA